MNMLSQLSAMNQHTRSAMRTFPLQVHSFDLSGPTHYVIGHDLSIPDSRPIRVFLRSRKSTNPSRQRPEIRHFSTNPWADLSDADLQNQEKLDEIAETLEAKCYTGPGGILQIQSAYEDTAHGAISANWISRLAASADEVGTQTVIQSPAWVRLNPPSIPRQGQEARKPYFTADVLYPEKAAETKVATDAARILREMLSSSATAAPGKILVAIRMTGTDPTTGEIGSGTYLLDRRAVKSASDHQAAGAEQYVDESPEATIERFWSRMSPALRQYIHEGLNAGRLTVTLVPGSRYRFIGEAIKKLEQPSEKRMHLHHEGFVLPVAAPSQGAPTPQPNDANEPAGEDEEGDAPLAGVQPVSGFKLCTIALRRHKPQDGATVSDEEFFPTGVWPLKSDAIPEAIDAMKF